MVTTLPERGYPTSTIDPLARLLYGQGLTAPLDSPDEALERLVAVQTQYAQSLEIALAVRSRTRLVGWESRALAADGHVIKSWGLRRTLHAHGPRGWSLVHGALGQRWHTRFHEKMPAWASHIDHREAEAKILELLAESPRSRNELHAMIPGLGEIPMVGWGLDVMGAAYTGRLKVIGRGADQRFALCEAGSPPQHPMVDLLRAYLTAYGPATPRDFAHWVGVPQRDIASTFVTVREELVETPTGFDLLGAAPSDLPRPPHAILLAKFDPLTLAHADKSRWLRAEDYPRIFRKAAQVEAVVLVRGQAAATWRLVRKAKHTEFVIEPFRALRDSDWSAIEKRAHKMAKSIGWPDPRVTRTPAD